MPLDININGSVLPKFNLNPKQLESVTYFDSPLLILAGAGTGKTKTLTSKIALLIASGVPPTRILAITFTNKAAHEMQQRVAKLVPYNGGMWIHTFHALGARLLRQYGGEIGLKKDFVIYDDDDQKKLIQLSMEELGYITDRQKIPQILNTISRAKDDLLDPVSYKINVEALGDELRMRNANIYMRYQKKLNDAGALDFGDLILRTAELLNSSKQVADRLKEFFQYILVDEYQDTNHAQYVLVKTLCAKHKNLCVVGDPDQSVYGWRGADIRNILEFEKDFKDAKTVVLEQNYRSTGNILKAANEVIKNNKNRRPKALWTSLGDGNMPKVLELQDETQEARTIINMVKQAAEKGKCVYNDVAVFYRTNAQSRSFEEACRVCAVPYRLVGSLRFYDRKEIKDSLAYLKLLVNPYDTVSLLRIINTPARGIGKTAVERIMQYSKEKDMGLYEALKHIDDSGAAAPAARHGIHSLLEVFEEIKSDMFSTTPSSMLEKVLFKSGYMKMIENEAEKDPQTSLERQGNLQELVNAVKEFEERVSAQGETPTLSKYLEEVMLTSQVDNMNADNQAVTLMTVHLAKGLEFPLVFLTGMEENLFPINSYNNSSPDDLEEERRLAYVGMTRAKKMLYMTWASTRRVFGQTYSNFMSRFIKESGLDSEFIPGPRAVTFDKGRGDRGDYGRRRDGNTYDRGSVTARPSPVPAPAARAEKTSGKRVIHPAFGPGVIVSQMGTGPMTKVTVMFDSGARQTFMLKFAPLRPL